MKKLTAMLLAMVMVISLVACSSSSSSTSSSSEESSSQTETEQETAEAEETETAGESTETAEEWEPVNTYKIGMNCWGASAYAMLAIANNETYVIEAFGNETDLLYDNFSIETLMQDLENLIADGVDGLIIWCPSSGMFERISQMCEEAEVPFVLVEKLPTDDVYDTLQANPYFVGAITPENASLGAQAAEYALEQGYTTAILTGSQEGDASDGPRADAFVETFEAGGGTILANLHSDSADDAVTQIQDALAACGYDCDIIYGVGSSFAASALTAIDNLQLDIPIVTSGIEQSSLEGLEDGSYKMVNGDYYVSAVFGTILLQNYLDGTPITNEDGSKLWIDDIQPFTVPMEAIGLLQEFFLDQNCYTDDELRQMSGLYNPDFGYDEFMDAMYSYSLEERLLARYEEGAVTAEELEAAGISVN
ncbi:MAG: substrate-binding domain-containing protein [Lachnospiraceae bacterium]|nr:substrate-binding domain-containing protein [Lachnospiraceae bacterium]